MHSQHYEEALKIAPEDKAAKDNYDFVKKKIEEQKRKQEENKPTPTPTPSPSPSQDQKKKDEQNQKDKSDQGKDQQKQQQKDEQPKDEQKKKNNRIKRARATTSSSKKIRRISRRPFSFARFGGIPVALPVNLHPGDQNESPEFLSITDRGRGYTIAHSRSG